MDFSYQLYSSRNFPPLDEALGRIAKAGYKQVEGFGGLYADAAGLAASVKKHGLSMPTGHFGLSQLKDTSAALKIAETLGMKMLYCPAIPKEERSQGEAKWVELGETLAQLGETFRKNGFGFGWHNHDFEFHPTESGRLPMDILLETAPNNEWEMDVAWVVRGGQDPAAWIKKYGPRINAVHVKDIAPAGTNVNEDGWADVGHGTIDWQSLQATIKAQTNVRYWVMEHDNPADDRRFAERSFAAVSAWK
ncbi:sugar phosphate isomerase/epimerase family protein [Devosia sp.]|jgi:sugar phosphate isomerase/epimerase|uniref:sugar phosphate isomerase/epimerase family protein n=1 Tax=Devosia sp. TaxID=1871048 RepID=UPI0037BE8008